MKDPFTLDESPLEIIPLLESAPSRSASMPSDRLDVAALAVELWRVKSRLKRVAPVIPAKDARPIESSVARIDELLAAAGFSVEDPEGRPYVEGDRVEVLLFESQDGLQRPAVIQTVKPAVFRDGVLMKAAEVIVGVPTSDARGQGNDP